jgi:large subunit ribosomal protein L24
MSRAKTHVNKNDEVVVISGNHKGSKGKILLVNPIKGTVLVEGVRLITKAVKKTQNSTEGGLIKKEGPIHISNVKKIGAEVATAPKKAAKKAAKKK